MEGTIEFLVSFGLSSLVNDCSSLDFPVFEFTLSWNCLPIISICYVSLQESKQTRERGRLVNSFLISAGLLGHLCF